AEAEIVAALEPGARQGVTLRVASLGGLLDDGTAGEAEAHDARNLVEGLAGGVVAGAAEADEVDVVAHEDEVAVAAGDDEADKGKLGSGRVGGLVGGGGEPVGVDVALEVVDADEGQAAGVGERLGGVET